MLFPYQNWGYPLLMENNSAQKSMIGRRGQRRSKYGTECASCYKPDAKLLASQLPRGPQMGQGPLKMGPNGPPKCPWLVWVHFRGARPIWRGSGWVRSQQFCFGFILRGAFWALFWPSRPPSQSDQIFMVQNGIYRCPAYSTTCLMFNSHLWRYFRPCEVIFTAFFAVSSDFLIRQFFKIEFLKIPQRPNFVIEILNPIWPSTFWTF